MGNGLTVIPAGAANGRPDGAPNGRSNITAGNRPAFDSSTGKPLAGNGRVNGTRPGDTQPFGENSAKKGLLSRFSKDNSNGKSNGAAAANGAPGTVNGPAFDSSTGKPLAGHGEANGNRPGDTRPSGKNSAKKGLLSMFSKDKPNGKSNGAAAANGVPGTVNGPAFDSSTGKPLAGHGDANGNRPGDTQPSGEAAPKKGLLSMFSKNKSKGKSNGAAAANPANGNGASPAKPSRLGGLFAKKASKELSTIYFDPGYLADPSMDGALRDVDVTYAVDQPFQYVQIRFDQEEGSLRYKVIEPDLSDDEQHALSIVEQGFEKMISTNLDLITGENRETYLQEKFLTIMKIFGIQATEEQKARMFFHLRKQYLGYSRMDTLMKDKYIEDISCNGSGIFFYVQHRIYGSIQTNVKFGEVELNNFVLKLAQIGGRHISLLQPIRDVTLPDGSRANITLGSEVTKKGSTFTIRKFRSNPISPIEMMEYGSIDAQQLAFLWLLMEYKRSILVSGGTATGKTTLLNVLCAFIPDEYKIVSIEDTAELNLMHPNWVQSVTRTGFGAAEGPSSASGISGSSRRAPGDISLYDLLVAALRQRPEFIIVGEVRGEEAFTLFQAIAVGHAALGTIHAGSMNELMARIESNPMHVPRSLFSNLDAVIFPMHIKKGERSMRRLANITEVLELDRDSGDLLTNTAFKWLPEQDVYKYQGRSYLLDRIRDIYGVNKDMLKAELVDRTRFLLWMKDQGVREYDQVTRLIRHYYRNKQAVMDQMNRDEGVHTLLMEEDLPQLPTMAVAATTRDPVDDLLE